MSDTTSDSTENTAPQILEDPKMAEPQKVESIMKEGETEQSDWHDLQILLEQLAQEMAYLPSWNQQK